MLYKKTFPKARTTTKVLEFAFDNSTDSTTDKLYCSPASARIDYNCTGANGALKHQYGVNEYTMTNGGSLEPPQDIVGCWRLDSGYVMLCKDGRLYCNRDGIISLISDRVFAENAIAIQHKLGADDALIIGGVNDRLAIYDGTQLSNSNCPTNFASMCVHYERVFGVSGKDNLLWFSECMNPLNWNIGLREAGYIELADDRGTPLAVVSFNDSLYVFRSRGISKITAYSDQTEFVVKHLNTSCGKVYPNTVAICDGNVLLLSDLGIFAFDGVTARRLLTKMDKTLIGADNSRASGCATKGKYMVAMQVEWGDNAVIGEEADVKIINNCMLIVDMRAGAYSFVRGVDISRMTVDGPADEAMLITRINNTGKVSVLDNSGHYYTREIYKSWQSASGDLGYSNCYKRIDYVVLYTRYPITLTIHADDICYYFHIKASDKSQRVPINVRGRVFSFRFHTDCNNMSVSKPKVVYTVFGNGI